MTEKTKTTIVNLEKALKHDSKLEDETKNAVREALNYIYESERMDEILHSLKTGEVLKYVSANMIAFNAKFYRDHKWEQIDVPEINNTIKEMFNA